MGSRPQPETAAEGLPVLGLATSRPEDRCELESCGVQFVKTVPWQKYCSRGCKREAMSQRTGRRVAWLSAEQRKALDAHMKQRLVMVPRERLDALEALERTAVAMAEQVTAMMRPAAEATEIDEEVKRSA